MNDTNEQSTIKFEQPVNDQARICLRLEHLARQFKHNLSLGTHNCSNIALQAILKTLNVIDRPDLKSKLSQALAHMSAYISQLERYSQVDKKKLHATLQKLNNCSDQLHTTKGKFGERLRNIEFLNQIRMQLNNPAGPCGYKLPAYALWLAKPEAVKIEHLLEWEKELDFLFKTADILLKIMRNTAAISKITAENGFYQQSLDASKVCYLISTTIDKNQEVYPEYSIGKHRLIIRFLTPNYLDPGVRHIQTSKNITSSLHITVFN